LKELQPDTPQSLKERKKTSICVADKIWRAFPCAPVMPFLYVGYKLCNIILVFGQILLMNAAVGNHIIHPQWGYEVVVALLKSGFNWEKTGLFPLASFSFAYKIKL
jgi:hypothetical protein